MLSTKEFIEKAVLVHNDKYSYELTNYNNSKSKVKIYCNNCMTYFEQTPSNHLSGYGCRKCSYKTFSKNDFITKAISIHGNKYNYDNTIYINMKTKINIYCNTCKVHFIQRPVNHLSGNDCYNCSNNKKKISREDFISRSIELHKQKYKYDNVVYNNLKTKVSIYCNICNKYFMQTPDDHLRSHGCRFCANNIKYCTDDFINKSKLIHNDKYEYNLVEYKGNKIKVTIMCKKHGTFIQKPNDHLSGKGCPKCKYSKLENLVNNYLLNNNIDFKYQFRHKSFVYDFYFSLNNREYIIECNGIQHYEFKKYFHRTYDKFEKQLERDNLLRKMCVDKGIILIEIPYYDIDNIKEILDSVFIKQTD